jgi:hypothetical protein
MWFLADVIGLFSIKVGSFSLNVGQTTPIFSANVVPKNGCNRVLGFMLSGRYNYKTEFISTVAKMTFCFKRIDNYPISKLLALWLVPAKVKACKNEYMTEDRIEYVLNLAKQNRIDINHF